MQEEERAYRAEEHQLGTDLTGGHSKKGRYQEGEGGYKNAWGEGGGVYFRRETIILKKAGLY